MCRWLLNFFSNLILISTTLRKKTELKFVVVVYNRLAEWMNEYNEIFFDKNITPFIQVKACVKKGQQICEWSQSFHFLQKWWHRFCFDVFFLFDQIFKIKFNLLMVGWHVVNVFFCQKNVWLLLFDCWQVLYFNNSFIETQKKTRKPE